MTCPGGQSGSLDLITLDDSGTYELDGGVDEGNLSGDLDFTANDAGGVEIEGDCCGFAGLPLDTIDGNNNDRVLDFIGTQAATVDTVVIQDGATGADGGGIRAASGALTVQNSLVLSNFASSTGGGIRKGSTGQLKVTSSIVIDNKVEAANPIGGGIYSQSPVEIENSGIANNTVTTVPMDGFDGALSGGGIALANGTGTITNTTIDDNHVTATEAGEDTFGGGLYLDGATVKLEGSTLSKNDINSSGVGGGAAVVSVAHLNTVNSTISGNAVTSGTSGNTPGGAGGGVSVLGNDATLVLTTVAENSAATAPGLHSTAFLTLKATIVDQGAMGCTGAPTANAFNVDRGESCVGPPGDTDLESTDPLLSALAPGGGSTITQVHTPGAGSPAIDAAVAAACIDPVLVAPVTEDQRGMPRPEDGDGNGAARCDGGSVEVQAPAPVPPPPPPAPTLTPGVATAPAALAVAAKKCRKGFKLKRGKCKRKKRKK